MIQRIEWVMGLLFFIGVMGFAQRTWEGTATVARYGEFPPSGMYGASNSFERNSIVDVENLSNGKRVRIIITGRVSDPTQFLIVSEQTAAELGIGKTEVARVRVSPVVTPGVDPSLLKPELPLSPDPDINPSARVAPGAKAEVTAVPPASIPSAPPVALPPPAEAQQPPAPSSSVTPSQPPSSISPVVPPVPVSPAPPVTSVAPAEPSKPRETLSTEAEAPWKEPDTANPYTGLETSIAKRDKSAFSGLSLILEGEAKTTEPLAAASPTVPEVKVESKEEGPKVSELPLAAIKPEPALKPESKEVLPSKEPPIKEDVQEIQTELKLALEPTGPKPPEPSRPPEPLKEEPSPSTVTEVPMATVTSSFPVKEVADLPRGFYYLQLGKFTRSQSAEILWERFHQQYPLVVVKEEKGLRVLVGPVKSDERGIIYHTFRALGMKDSFFVKID